MKNIHNVLMAAAAALAAASPVALHAQATPVPAAAVKPVADKAGEMSEGEVRKIDKAGKKITLRHGPLKNLDMPPMTMVFQVSDPTLLDKVKAGDKVLFVAANPGGKLTVTQLQPVK